MKKLEIVKEKSLNLGGNDGSIVLFDVFSPKTYSYLNSEFVVALLLKTVF